MIFNACDKSLKREFTRAIQKLPKDLQIIGGVIQKAVSLSENVNRIFPKLDNFQDKEKAGNNSRKLVEFLEGNEDALLEGDEDALYDNAVEAFKYLIGRDITDKGGNANAVAGLQIIAEACKDNATLTDALELAVNEALDESYWSRIFGEP
jgi:hypothetical protein